MYQKQMKRAIEYNILINKRIFKSCYIVFVFIHPKVQPSLSTMTSAPSSQSQPSYLQTIQEKPSFQAISPQQLVDQMSATTTMRILAQAMSVEQGYKFEQCLRSLNVLFEKGYSHLLITYPLLLRKLMNHFTKLGKQLQDNVENSKLQLRMLYVLSVIAQLLRNNPKFYYPFTRKFLITMFSIDGELLHKSAIKNQILAILAVIYENLSRQPKLVTKYNIEMNLKQAILGNYSLIEEVSTLKIMNKSICNLTAKGINFSVGEFHKYKVLQTVSGIIAKSQLDLFLVKMKMSMISPTPEKSAFKTVKMDQSETEMADQKSI